MATRTIAIGIVAMVVVLCLAAGANVRAKDGCEPNACDGTAILSVTLPCNTTPDPCVSLEAQALLAAVSEAGEDCDVPNDCFCIAQEPEDTQSDCTRHEIGGGNCKFTATASHQGRCEEVGE